MVATIAIAGRAVGDGQRCFVIAEAGVNHNGSVELAKRLVDAALEAGADAVKFQTWVTEKLIVADAPMAEYQKQNVGQDSSQFEMLKQLELSYDDFREIKEYADGAGILFFSTPDEEDSADFLDELGVPLFKIGSGEVTNIPFLRHIGNKGKPIVLSTGMSTLGEVEAAVRAIEATGNRQLVLLHCVSDYPADPADCNLKAMQALKTAFQYPVGFSDHTLGIHVPIAAVAMGACVLEKHLTLDTSLPGPDQAMSLQTGGFAEMVKALNSVQKAMGTGRKTPTNPELDTKLVVQKTIVAARDLPEGKVLQTEDLMVRRASGGLPPEHLDSLIGKRAKQLIPASRAVSLSMLE